MRKSLLAMTLLVAVSSPTAAADAQLENLLVTIKKLNGKVGKTDYLTVHLSDTKVSLHTRRAANLALLC